MTYVRMAILAGVLAALIGAFFFGVRTGVNRETARNAKVMARAIAVQEKARQAIETLSGQVAEAQRDQTTETRTIYSEAIRYVDRTPASRNVCLAGDAVQLLDRARDNANRTPPGSVAGDAAAPAADAPQR